MLPLEEYRDLPEPDVQQNTELISSYTQEQVPSVDLRFGPLQTLVMYVSAMHHTAIEQIIETERRSNSLATIAANPEAADPEMVNKVVSNRGLRRKPGRRARGIVTIVVSQLATVTVANGTIFEAEGRRFSALASYTARIAQESVTGGNDRVLLRYGDNYSFTIDVEDLEEGSAGQIKRDTLLAPASVIVNFVKAFATSDFTNGRDQESNRELVERELDSFSGRTLSNRGTMSASLRDRFEDVLARSAVGFGDAEMLRDRHSLWPISGGGRVDWYIRTQELPQRLRMTLEAVLIEKTSDGYGIWQLSLDRDDAPGFYDVLNIVPSDAGDFSGGMPILSNERQFDLSSIDGVLSPDIVNTAEGMFTRYQTAIVRFRDTLTLTGDMTVGDYKNYNILVRVLPSIADIQSWAGSREFRFYGGDVLVKAPVPCFCSLSFVLDGRPGAAQPDPYLLQNAIAKYVNTLGFAGRLHASSIFDVAYDYLPDGVNISQIDLYGQILRPNGTIKTLRSTDVIEVPYEPDNMVTARTVCFYLDPEDIRISARTVSVPVIL
jgi:hypothetical protein